MDCTVNNLENTSDTEREAMVSKLHNMQWLKSRSYSPNSEKIKAACIEAHLVEESVAHPIDICEKHLSNDMPKSDENTWNKAIDTANLFSNANELIIEKGEAGDILSIVESLVTAKVEAQFCVDKEQKDQSNTLQDNTEEITRDVCPNLSSSQKVDQDIEEPLTKTSDDNNNHSKLTAPNVSKINNQTPTCKVTDKGSKASTEIKDKDMHIKKTSESRMEPTIKNEFDTSFKADGKPSTPSSNSKKPMSNSPKLLKSADKNDKIDRFNNKPVFTKNIAYIRRKEYVKQQQNISRNKTEKETKDVTTKSSPVKTELKTESNKTADTCQSKTEINKDKTLQKQQQRVSKQFVSKSKEQESCTKSAPVNQSVDKKSEKIVDEKNCERDQKMDDDVNRRRNSRFVTQYKNSTYSKQARNNPKNTEYAALDGRNSSYTRNNSRFNRKRNGGNGDRRPMTNEYTSNECSKSNTKTKEPYANNSENHSKSENNTSCTQSINVKSSSLHEMHKLDDKASDDKNINPVKAETHLTEDKKYANLTADCTEPDMSAKSKTLESCHEETKVINKVGVQDKADSENQQHKEMNNKVDNGEVNRSKHSSNLHSDKCTAVSQANVIYQYVVKPESVQCTGDVNQLGSSQVIWHNYSSDNVMHKSATATSSPQTIQSVPFSVQQAQLIQADNQMRQMSQWQPDSSKFYDQHFSAGDAMCFSPIPNTLDAALPYGRKYDCNVQTPYDNAIILETMSRHRESPNLLYRCADNCLPHPVIYAPSCMQTWDPQLQYNPALAGYAPGYFYNSPYEGYAVYPDAGQLNSFTDIGPMQEQPKYLSYVQMNDYARGAHSDLNNCAVRTRNFVDNAPLKSSQCYKSNNQDNCRTVYAVPQYVMPVSHSRQGQQPGMNLAFTAGQPNSYCPTNQKHYKQATNCMQMRNSRNQMIKLPSPQDLGDDNGPEVVPPMISPREFITNNVSLSNKPDQFATRVFKPEFKTRPNAGHHPPPYQKHNGGYRRNTIFQNFQKEFHPRTAPIGIGRGAYKAKIA